MTAGEPNVLEKLATVRKERSNLRVRAEKYKIENERATNPMNNALHRPGGARRGDTLQAVNGWPTSDDLLHTWGDLVVEEKIGELERGLQARGALQP